jgi:multisubunit Na+/H+ antiporter MnhB subunit
MVIVLIILSVGLLGMIIYFAISPKSSRLLRLSALIALGVIGISILVCGILIIRGPKKEMDSIPLHVFQETASKAQPRNIWDIIILAVFLIIVSLVIVKAIVDQRKPGKTAKKAEKSSPVFQENDELDLNIESNDEDDDEESFDISSE